MLTTGAAQAVAGGDGMSMVMPEPPFRLKGVWCKSDTKEKTQKGE